MRQIMHSITDLKPKGSTSNYSKELYIIEVSRDNNNNRSTTTTSTKSQERKMNE